jgi:hypothetical protein
MEEFIKKVGEPIFKLVIDAEVRSKVIQRHYVKTISEISGKSEEEIKNELIEIEKQVRSEMTAQLTKSLNKS